jgi:cobaltochelatase CobS
LFWQKIKSLNNAKGKEKVANMIKVASLTRKGFIAGDISTVMSPRTGFALGRKFRNF